MKLKKVKAILLALSISAAILLAACQPNDDNNGNNIDANINGGNINVAGGNGNNGENGYNNGDDIVASHWDTLGGRDFDGMTFTILDANPNPTIWANVPSEEMAGEAINDALLRRNTFIEETFGVNFEFVQIVGENTGTNTLRNSILAGEDTYDMVIARVMGGDMAALATGGMLLNLIDMPYLSLEAPWWSRLMYQNMQFDGTMFFSMGDIVPAMYNAPAAMFFNRQMMLDHGRDDNLYELVLYGRWTLDELERITRDVDQDIDQNGTMYALEDIFGVVVERLALTSSGLAASAGINLSTIRDGEIVVDLGTQFVADRVARLHEVFGREYDWGGATVNIIRHTFYEGRAMFLGHYLESGTRFLRGMEQDYGIVPMPKFNEQQESYVSFLNAWNSVFVGVPLNANADNSAFIMEALAYGSYTMVRSAVHDVVLEHIVARDEESARMIDIIIETSYLDLNSIYNWGGSTDVLRNAIFDGASLISELEARQGQIESAIAAYMNTIRGE